MSRTTVTRFTTQTQIPMGTAGTSRLSTSETPPSMPPTCRSVNMTIRNQAQTSQEARRRGPGARSKASRVVSPVPMAYRPSSF